MIDSYTHCGIDKYEPVESVVEAMEYSGITRAVLVQHIGQFDNSYIESVVKNNPETFTGVGLVDTTDTNWRSQIGLLRDSDSFTGIRFSTPSIIASFDAVMEAGEMGLHLILYTPDGIGEVCTEIAELARKLPDTSIVVTHLGCPGKNVEVDRRNLSILGLGEFANVLVGLSGQHMFCEYPYIGLLEYTKRIVETYTSSRIMWGSNFPVCGSMEEYRMDLSYISSEYLELSELEIQDITENTARRVFFPDN
tara:strand:+ start:1009 stop:1761 length:753 start_codon:yes stop_codon:yes gene_type:complete